MEMENLRLTVYYPMTAMFYLQILSQWGTGLAEDVLLRGDIQW